MDRCNYYTKLILLSADKPWAERLQSDGIWAYDELDQSLETSTFGKEIRPEALVASPTWDDHGNAWSAVLGAIGGAGTVLLVAAAVLLWRKPRRRELPLLAPMDIGHNVSSLLTLTLNY